VIPLTIFSWFPIPEPTVKKVPNSITVTLDRRKEEWAGVAQLLHFDEGCILNSGKLDATPMGFRIGDELQGGM